MTAKSRFLVGIDLGTTNSVAAYVDSRRRSGAVVQLFEIPQLVDAGQVAPRPQLPSFLYLPGAHELSPESLALPWDRQRSYAVGEFARERGGQLAGRLVASAKSWLCNAAVDRKARILPWGAAAEVERVTPIEASSRYLAHIRDAWNHTMAAGNERDRLERQQLIVTVPASFDEVARELTLEAAHAAGLEQVTLIEEPQAAFYNWIYRHADVWRERVAAEQWILVCDVGGGTTDFSLIQVEERQGELGFRRLAVGDHLLLGGDNMDLALAGLCEPNLAGAGKKLDPVQWGVLRHACRKAKEELLAPAGPERVTVAIPGRGSSLIGGMVTCSLDRSACLACVVDGFFPATALGEPVRRGAPGLQELGLPYAPDAAVSRHLSAFLHAPTGKGEHGHRRPDLVLFNGGVFRAAVLQQRVVGLLRGWFPEAPPPQVLECGSEELYTAVAAGAAYYGLVRRGQAVRIASGLARSYYLGLADHAPAAAGEVPTQASHEAAPVGGAAQPEPPRLALCVAAQGLDEGQEVAIADRQFELLVRLPVVFPVYASSVRPLDRTGDIVPVDLNAMVALPPVTAVLETGPKAKADRARVHLHTILTEVGTLEIWCVRIDGTRRWRLQFAVRQGQSGPASPAGPSAIADEEIVPPEVLEPALNVIRHTFARPGGELRVETLMKNLERQLERSRGDWLIGLLRGLWPATIESAERRKAEAHLEIRWLNLAGFLLRPGFGFPLDEWRLKELWRLFPQGVQHRKNRQARAEWWILWRRVAGGLTKPQQHELLRRLLPLLLPAVRRRPAKSRAGNAEQEEIEAWRAAASLERIEPVQKQQLAEALLESIAQRPAAPYELWALGRLGARVPFHGPADVAVNRQAVETWIAAILDRSDIGSRDGTLALVELARRSGDRVRDIDEDLRRRVVRVLRDADAAPHLVELVERGGTLEQQEAALVFGESLPTALRLVE